MYDRLWKISKELSIKYALPAPVPKQASSQTSGRKRKHMELEPEFGDQAFQRWSDINKVEMEALVSYLVAASMVKSPENARFSMKLRKLIAEQRFTFERLNTISKLDVISLGLQLVFFEGRMPVVASLIGCGGSDVGLA
ncbi:hypothetical protein Tco_0340446 [Tanacetum coccineum]